jgi:hypothetical protein
MMVCGHALSCMGMRGHAHICIHMCASHGCAGSCVDVRMFARFSTCVCASHMHAGLCGVMWGCVWPCMDEYAYAYLT